MPLPFATFAGMELSAREIIAVMAKRRMVEDIVQRNCADLPDKDKQDLAQYVYEVLLRKPEPIIRDLWHHAEMEYYVVRIVLIQRGTDSTFYRTFTRWRLRCVRIGVHRSEPHNAEAEEEAGDA